MDCKRVRYSSWMNRHYSEFIWANHLYGFVFDINSCWRCSPAPNFQFSWNLTRRSWRRIRTVRRRTSHIFSIKLYYCLSFFKNKNPLISIKKSNLIFFKYFSKKSLDNWSNFSSFILIFFSKVEKCFFQKKTRNNKYLIISSFLFLLFYQYHLISLQYLLLLSFKFIIMLRLAMQSGRSMSYLHIA